MTITGSMWRVRPNVVTSYYSHSNMTVMDECLAYHPWRDDHFRNIVRSLESGEVVLVSGEPQRVPAGSCSVHTEFTRMVPVVLPVVGWLNDTYFTKDSMWLERIA